MRIAIVEDEAPIARRLERAVQRILGDRIRELELVPTLSAALAHVRSRPLDLVFLDLNLQGRDGFELLVEAAAARFSTIVVSAHEEQAIRAFEIGVADFVPKPWTEARLRLAIERATGAVPGARRAAWLAVPSGSGVELIDVERVVAVRGADDYSELHLEGGATRLHAQTLAALERVLPSAFARVHRSWIVNLGRVRGWTAAPGGRASLDVAGMTVPVGRTFRRETLARVRGETPDPPERS